LASPVYVAPIASEPASSVFVVQVNVTLALTGTEVQPLIALPPTVKFTTPVGVMTVAGVVLNVAVKVTDWFTVEGACEDARPSVAAFALTVCETAVEGPAAA